MRRCKRNTRAMVPWNILLGWSIFLAVQNKGAFAQDCQFRTDLCDWSNYGDVDWVQRSDSTSTGTEHCAGVLVTDTTPPGPHQAVLTSMTQPHVMTMLGFHYRLGAPNTLTVVAQVAGLADRVLTQRNGTHGAGWIEVDIGLELQSSNFKISFKADVPENSTGFVGLTNVTLKVGVDECASMPCQNGGVCIDGNNSFTCVCSSGFKGEVCQIDMNPRPKTTVPPTATTLPTTRAADVDSTTPKATTVKTPPSGAPPKPTAFKTPPSSDPTIRYGTASSSSTPGKLPQTGDGQLGTRRPTTIAVVAVCSVVLAAVLVTTAWLLAYFKKRSWRPRYRERGVSMESVSNSGSLHGRWTSTVDIPGSTPGLKPELTPVEETEAFPKKVENIYVTSPTVGLVNTGYNIDSMY